MRRCFPVVDGIGRPPFDEDFDSAGGELQASVRFGHGYLHPELLNSCNS